MTTTTYPTIFLRKKEEKRLVAGHLWAFSNELTSVPKDISSGSIVVLARETDEMPLALAFFNPHSLIAARILTRNVSDTIDRDFFLNRIRKGLERRRILLGRRNAARIVHAESDFLPGLIVDKFNDILSFQISSAGFEVRKELIINILKEIFQPKAIVERNSSYSRKLEGLEAIDGLVYGTETTTEIHDELGTRFEVDVLKGQKTGFYLDQMENRTAVGKYVAQGASALDLFTNNGGFAINLNRAGAGSITAVDSSQDALDRLKHNSSSNDVEANITTIAADCFEYLASETKQYDLVVLDPPALVKSRRELLQAKKAYVTLNAHAMRCTAKEGILVTASCSHLMSREYFLDAIKGAASKSRRAITILEERGAASDHPVLLEMPETEYLHLFVLRVH